MIISESRRFVFIHNPKAGGTTVRAALTKFDTTGHFFWMFHELNGRQVDKAHMPLHVFRQAFPGYFALLQESFTFMLVRDPYARAVSAFNETNPELLEAVHMAADGVSARALYLEKVNEFICSIRNDSLSGWELPYRHAVRQRDMAYLGPKCLVDCIVKLENIEQTSRKLDVFDPEIRRAVLATPKENVKTGSLPVREVLSPASVKNINEHYRDDFYLFDYEMW